MLANLRPGPGDLRTPQAVGYLCHIGLWLLFNDRLPRSGEDEVQPIRAVFEFGGAVGQATVLGAPVLHRYAIALNLFW